MDRSQNRKGRSSAKLEKRREPTTLRPSLAPWEQVGSAMGSVSPRLGPVHPRGFLLAPEKPQVSAVPSATRHSVRFLGAAGNLWMDGQVGRAEKKGRWRICASFRPTGMGCRPLPHVGPTEEPATEGSRAPF